MRYVQQSSPFSAGDVQPGAAIDNDRRRIDGTLTAVAIVALVVNALSLSASQLWVCPDSSYYVALAGGIADRLDVTNELFLIRPPGYPLLLAGIFVVFGSWSPVAIAVVQHVLAVGIAVLTSLIAWHLTLRRSVALLAGLLTACSLQLLAFANVIITEVPYTFTLVLSVYFLVRYHRGGGRRHLVLASLTGGVAWWIRPTGLSIVAICVGAAMHRAWLGSRGFAKGNIPAPADAGERRHGSASRSRQVGRKARGLRKVMLSRRLAGGLALAVVPAFVVALPASTLNILVHGAGPSGRCANLALYYRLLAMDGLDSPSSEALADIRATVSEAVQRGAVPKHADYRQWGAVWHAYQAVRGLPLLESTAVMSDACWDLIREHPGTTLKNTIRYAYWMLMVPDSFYRFHPGGAGGIRTPTGEYVRDANADILDISTYQPTLQTWIRPYGHYLPLQAEPRAATPLWRGIARWFYTCVDKGRSFSGLAGSPFEEFSWLCMIGAVVSLFTRERTACLLVIGVIVLQILPSAFLGGPTPRYAVPVNPLLLVFAALLPAALVRGLATVISPCRAVMRRYMAERLPGRRVSA